jgi:hypothetical protein
MIQFNPMTLKACIDRVMMAVSQFRTSVNLDEGTVIMFINRSIREALLKTLAFKDFAYISTFPVSNGAPLNTNVAANVTTMRSDGRILPANFLRPKRVILRPVGAEEGDTYTEARPVDVKEFFGLSDWYRANTHDKATLLNPIYTIWGQQGTTLFPVANSLPVQSVPRFYCAPYTNAVFTDQTGTAPTGFSYYTGGELEGFMDAYLAPQDVSAYSDILPIPFEFEELVITLTILRVLVKMEETNLLFYKQKSAEELAKAKRRYLEYKQTDRIQLESFVDTVPGLAAQGQGSYIEPQPNQQ